MAHFLPDDYEAPSGSNYLNKFPPGRTRLRILTPALVGNRFWRTEEGGRRQPVRRRMNQPIRQEELEINPASQERESPRHFWAMLVWNYNAKQVQIWELDKRTIQQAIMTLNETPEWGDPLGYDLSINKKGEGWDTEYNVLPTPRAPLPSDIAEQCETAAGQVNLELLFDGLDPFQPRAAAPGPSKPPPSHAEPPTASPAVCEFHQAEHRDVKTPRGTVASVWSCETSAGRFGTIKREIGEQLIKLARGARLQIDWTATGPGNRIDKLTVLPPRGAVPVHEEAAADDGCDGDERIPF